MSHFVGNLREEGMKRRREREGDSESEGERE